MVREMNAPLYGRELTYADETDVFALVEEFYCIAKEALPIPSSDDGLGFRDLWMSGPNPDGEGIWYNDTTAVEPLVLQAICAEMLSRGIDPGYGDYADDDSSVGMVMAFVKTGKKYDVEFVGITRIESIGFNAARRVGMALSLLS